MQVEWYRSFTEAVKWKSMSKAADKLSLTQPAISKHIRHLEAAYGVELFRRGAAGVELTEAGELFLERIAPVVQALSEIEAEMRPFAEHPKFALGSLPSVAAQVLPHRLRDYHAAGYPLAVTVRLSSEELMEGLQSGGFDAVLVDAACAGGRQWSRELFTEGYIAVVPEDHPLRGRTGVTAAELANEPFVFPVCCDTRTRFEALAERCGYRPDVKMETDNTDYLLGLVAVGTGITVLPGLFKGQAERLGLHAVPIAEESLRRTIVLAARTAGTGSRLYRLLDGSRPRETGVRAAVPGI